MTANAFGFDVEQVQKLFKLDEFSKMFQDARLPGVDPEAVMAAQKKNMDALVAANKAAASGYQELFSRQVSLLEEGVANMRDNLNAVTENAATAEGQKKNAEIAKTAFEKAIADLTELADSATKTHKDAFGIVQARVQESIEELQALAPKA